MTTLFKDDITLFPSSYKEILQRVNKIEPVKYGVTRNYLKGAVTYLSPYISRGVISTKFIMEHILDKGHDPARIEKFIQELAWRDYWQQIWVAKGDAINSDLKRKQSQVSNTAIPRAIIEAGTGITAIDNGIQEFYKTGYLHNHLRMYIASIACNVAQSYWKLPSQWMYYHLLDGDWASNALSWQWVAGANSNKKYYANQQNINKYCYTRQKGTFLDVSYESFKNLEIPGVLRNLVIPQLKTPLPQKTVIEVDNALPTLIYNFYNLDPLWEKGIPANRILLIEPSHFEQFPVAQKSIDFMLALSKNIDGIQTYVGEFNQLIRDYDPGNVYYKEHPLNKHYQGNEVPRDWMFDVKGYYPSFFAFWKKCKKEFNY